MKKLTAVLMFLLIPLTAFAAKEEVYIFNWSEYIDPAIIKQFESETGIKVRYTTYDSNEAMYAKLKLMRKGGYDLAVPSTYFVDRMRRTDMLQPLDKRLLPNLEHLDPTLLDKDYDPGNIYSLPYMWGSSAIGINTRKVDPGTVTSWNDLWRPEFQGRILLMDDVREVFAMALRSLGYSGNTTDPEQIKAAYEKLRTLKPGVKVFNSDSPRQPYLNNEVIIGQIWGGEVYMANEEMPELAMVYPREGAIFWVDSLVIPKGARNAENAHKFINFLMRPDIAKQNCEYIGYATPNRTAHDRLSPATRNHKAAYPDQQDLDNGEFQADVGEAILIYEKYWELLKTDH